MDPGYAAAYRELYERHWWWRARAAFVRAELDRLRPGGYGRMFKYLGNLEKRMRDLEVTDIEGYVFAAEGAK